MTKPCSCSAPGACVKYETIKNATEFETCEEAPSRGQSLPCVYLDKAENLEEGRQFYRCNVFGQCTQTFYHINVQSCDSCTSRVDPKGDMRIFKDPLEITSKERQKTHALRGMLGGGAAFLVGGGPSVLSINYAALGQTGVFSLGVNNIAAMVPVKAFICSDPVEKFHHSIFTNPTVMKFVPTAKLGNTVRIKQDDTFVKANPAIEYPNVWGYRKRGWSAEDRTFFTEPAATIGNFDEGVRKLGAEKGVLTLLAGLRVLYYLGARTIYLVGCDFSMSPETPYAFDQGKNVEGVAENNRRYEIIGAHLAGLRPVFERFGLNVLNTNENSGLKAFPFVDFDHAVQDTLQTSGVATPASLSSWYEK